MLGHVGIGHLGRMSESDSPQEGRYRAVTLLIQMLSRWR